VHNTQQTEEMNSHALSEIRTRDHGSQAAADQRLGRHGHRGRLSLAYADTIYGISKAI